MAGCIADGVITAALALVGASGAAAIVTAAAARPRNNLRIEVPPCASAPCIAHAHTIRARSNRIAVWDVQLQFRSVAASRRRHGRALQRLDFVPFRARSAGRIAVRLVPDVLPQ
jgi:hypothetical protein